MQVTKESAGECALRLKFTVDAEAVNKAFGRAFRDISQYARVPGFRPGKAPRAILEQFVDAERVRERAAELLAPAAYREGLQSEGITPYGEPDVTFGDLQKDSAWEFEALVYTEPTVSLSDYTGITVERPSAVIGDSDVTEAIDRLRADRARIEVVEGRGVAADDMVIANVSITPEEAETPVEPRRSLIRMGQNIPGFDEAVMGQQVDEERTFVLTYPDDYQDPELVGKQATFNISVVSISERRLPELTDDWVKENFGVDTVDALREESRKQLEVGAARTADQVVQGRIIEQLVARATVEFPIAMAAEEARREHARLEAELEQRSVSFERYLEMSNVTEEQYEDQLRARAVARVRQRLVLAEFAKLEGVTISSDDVDSELQSLLADTQRPQREVKKIARDNRARSQVANMVIERRLNDALLAIAQVVDAAPTSA